MIQDIKTSFNIMERTVHQAQVGLSKIIPSKRVEIEQVPSHYTVKLSQLNGVTRTHLWVNPWTVVKREDCPHPAMITGKRQCAACGKEL